MKARGKILRVTFVHAPDLYFSNTQNYGTKFMPVWVYTLGAHIPDDGRFEIQLFDPRFQDYNDLEEAEVFLFSGINQEFDSIEAMHLRLKGSYPQAIPIVGGPICWSFDQAGTLDQLKYFDHVFVGEGEDSITGILENVYYGNPMKRVMRAKARFNISEAKPYHRSMLDSSVGRYYGGVLEVSRGCPL